MEPVSAGVGMTLFYTIATNSYQFGQSIRNTKGEVERAIARVESLSHNIDLLRKFEVTLVTATDHAHQELREEVKRTVTSATQSMTKIQALIPKAVTKPSKKSRVRWLLSDRATFMQLMIELAQTQISVSNALQVVQLAVSLGPALNSSHSGNHTSHQEHGDTLSDGRPDGGSSLQNGEMPVVDHDDEDDDASGTARYHSYDLPKPPRLLRRKYFGGMCEVMLRKTSGTSSSHSRTEVYSAQLQLYGRLVFMIRGEIRSQWCKNGFRLFLPATLTFTALVSADSEFMAACRDGDLARMHTLLVDGRASPMDRTDEGVTPLCLTIKNGHTEATRLLLESGADATEAFGEKETSPLCWAVKHRHLDICRLLIRRRASFHHLTLHGWSALFYLWPTTTAGCHPLSADMIKVLVGEEMDFDYLHQGIVDRHGWGLIHRASVFGRPEDVELLIAVGVDAFQPIGDPAFGWTTIHNVVDYGVHGNFLVLFPKYVERYGNNPALDRDSRGWTLLHIAIAQPGERFHQGHTRIIRTLLEFGADAYALTDAIQEQHDGPERQDVPEVGGDDEVESAAFPPRIHGIRCSPSELALAYGGTERQLEWQNILQNFVNNSNAAAGHETDAHETDDDRHYDSDGDDDWPETMDTPIE